MYDHDFQLVLNVLIHLINAHFELLIAHFHVGNIRKTIFHFYIYLVIHLNVLQHQLNVHIVLEVVGMLRQVAHIFETKI